MSRRALALVALAVVSVVGTAWWWQRTRAADPIEWQGYAEADFVKVGPTQQGLLTALHVRRGSRIDIGTPLFDQDDMADCAARDQAMRQLAQAEEQLANLKAGGKPTEIKQAQANLADAVAARDKIAADLSRNETLVKTGAATAQLVDQERADLRSANAKIDALDAALAQLRAPMGREREITAQRAAVEALRSALEMARWRLDQRHVVSPVAGVVADVMARPGETIPAGGPVVSLLPPENVFVRFFVPEQRLAQVHLGDRVALICDNCPRDFNATISFISPQAEYTPPVIYSETIRAKLVYMVEARPSREEAARINPGQPIAVRPLAQNGS